MKTSKLIKKVSGKIYIILGYTERRFEKIFESIPGYGEKSVKGKKAVKNWAGYLSLKKIITGL